MLELADIRKIYKVGPIYKEVLGGLFLTVYQGDLLSVLGRSQNEKSTLLRIMGFLEKPTSGSIEFENEEIGGFDENKLCSLRNFAFGYVLESLPLINRLSVLENVILPLKARSSSGKAMEEQAMETLRNTGAEEAAFKMPYHLTDIMKFRVSMARAVVGEPDIILIDEPKASSGTSAGQEMLDLVFTANDEGGMAVVFATDKEAVANQFTRKVGLERGLIDGYELAPPAAVAPI